MRVITAFVIVGHSELVFQSSVVAKLHWESNKKKKEKENKVSYDFVCIVLRWLWNRQSVVKS